MFQSNNSNRLALVVMTAFMLPWTTQGFVSSPATRLQQPKTMESSTLLRDCEDDSMGAAAPLPLTASDLQRLTMLKSRHKTMPLMIMEAMVPGQSISFQRCVRNTTVVCVFPSLASSYTLLN